MSEVDEDIPVEDSSEQGIKTQESPTKGKTSEAPSPCRKRSPSKKMNIANKPHRPVMEDLPLTLRLHSRQMFLAQSLRRQYILNMNLKTIEKSIDDSLDHVNIAYAKRRDMLREVDPAPEVDLPRTVKMHTKYETLKSMSRHFRQHRARLNNIPAAIDNELPHHILRFRKERRKRLKQLQDPHSAKFKQPHPPKTPRPRASSARKRRVNHPSENDRPKDAENHSDLTLSAKNGNDDNNYARTVLRGGKRAHVILIDPEYAKSHSYIPSPRGMRLKNTKRIVKGLPCYFQEWKV